MTDAMSIRRRLLLLYYVCGFVVWLSVTVYPIVDADTGIDSSNGNRTRCSDLMMGQYRCDDVAIDPDTQQAAGCDQETRTAKVSCLLAPGVRCVEQLADNTFLKNVSCKWTNGHSFEKALLLSVFLGMFGVDRFYLGYPAIGLVKFATLGFMFLWQLVDILLIATQVVKPSDGSEYVIDYYGAATQRIMRNNYTYLKPPDYG